MFCFVHIYKSDQITTNMNFHIYKIAQKKYISSIDFLPKT